MNVYGRLLNVLTQGKRPLDGINRASLYSQTINFKTFNHAEAIELSTAQVLNYTSPSFNEFPDGTVLTGDDTGATATIIKAMGYGDNGQQCIVGDVDGTWNLENTFTGEVPPGFPINNKVCSKIGLIGTGGAMVTGQTLKINEVPVSGEETVTIIAMAKATNDCSGACWIQGKKGTFEYDFEDNSLTQITVS